MVNAVSENFGPILIHLQAVVCVGVLGCIILRGISNIVPSPLRIHVSTMQ